MEVGFVHSGKTWRASFAALFASLVLVTGIGASPASADHVAVSFDNRVVDPTGCKRANEYDHRVWLSGQFETDGRKLSSKRFFPAKTHYFNGCYRILPNGKVLTAAGALWIVDGSWTLIDGYVHGEKIANDGVGPAKRLIDGTFEIDGVQTKLNGLYSVTSQGEIWFRNDFHRLGEWSDWYESGVRSGYAAAQRRLDACFNRISLVSVEPKTYGPELTFEVMQYLPEVPAERVVIGFREIEAGSRQPQIVSGENALPWCVKSWFRYDTEGPRLTLDLGATYVFGYDKNGPYYQEHTFEIPGWVPKKYHNEDIWASWRELPVMG